MTGRGPARDGPSPVTVRLLLAKVTERISTRKVELMEISHRPPALDSPRPCCRPAGGVSREHELLANVNEAQESSNAPMPCLSGFSMLET